MTTVASKGSVSWTVQDGPEVTTAVWDPPTRGGGGPVFVCAHGAGGHLGDRLTRATTAALGERGWETVRFNFLYRERRSPRPDPMPRLVSCFQAVIDRVQRELSPRVLVIGGRSMGGRAASVLVANQPTGQGLLLFAYPLHPPGQPEKIRDAHLASITEPVLCLNGTRDAFCDRDLMATVVGRLGPNWRMYWVKDADHSFHVLKRSGRNDSDVLREIVDAAAAWAASL